MAISVMAISWVVENPLRRARAAPKAIGDKARRRAPASCLSLVINRGALERSSREPPRPGVLLMVSIPRASLCESRSRLGIGSEPVSTRPVGPAPLGMIQGGWLDFLG